MKRIETRRDFLFKLSAVTLAMPLLDGCTTAQKAQVSELDLIKKNANKSNCNWCGAIDAPRDLGWRANFASRSEKGEPLVVSGTVYLSDGKTPAPNVLIYAYHTDTEGLYGRNGEPRHGRFRGWMLTDAKGRYEITTIKPAPYPNGGAPAHIHYTITGKTFKEDWIDDVWFDGDKYINDENLKRLKGKGGFNSILQLKKNAAGVLHGIRDIRLEKSWV